MKIHWKIDWKSTRLPESDSGGKQQHKTESILSLGAMSGLDVTQISVAISEQRAIITSIGVYSLRDVERRGQEVTPEPKPSKYPQNLRPESRAEVRARSIALQLDL